MPMTAEQIVAEALRLPPKERAAVIDQLSESLDAAPLTEMEKLWATEARRRADELLSGKVKGIPREEVFAEVRRSLGQ
jgi:putative addiction module component (TIGR02574 family)